MTQSVTLGAEYNPADDDVANVVLPIAAAVWNEEPQAAEQEPTLLFSDSKGQRVYQAVELADFTVPQKFTLLCRAVGPPRPVLIEGQSIRRADASKARP